MKITIITVCFNSAATIEKSILSVLNQDYPFIEYIIIDGGSKDATLSVIDKYRDRIATVISEKDKGIYDAMNKGVLLASGDVVGILNSDDFYCSNNILSGVAQVFNSTEAEAVYGDLSYVSNENENKIVRTWQAGRYKKNSFKFGWMPPHPTFFVKRQVYQQYGSFNITLKSAADYELMLRFIHKMKIRVEYLPVSMVYMRAGGVSNANFKNRIRANKEDQMAWKLNHLKPFFFTFWLKPVRKIGQFFKRSDWK